MTKAKKLSWTAWGLAAAVVIAAATVWLQSISGHFHFDGYHIFPLLGLLAFSLMWTHYIVGALRRHYKVSKAPFRAYFKYTGIVVLLAILLHPGLLILQLWKDGFGFPPQSYLENYVAPSGKFAALLGSISLVIFLAFELKRKFGNRSWWKLVEYAQMFAMLAIFSHALKLGGALQFGWFRTLWLLYGVTFVIAVMYTYLFNDEKEEPS